MFVPSLHSQKQATFLGISGDDKVRAEAAFLLCLTGMHPKFRQKYNFSNDYHPPMYWAIEGDEIDPFLTPVSKASFSLFPHAAGNERSSKRRTQIHTTVRNCLTDRNADMQSYALFNKRQLQRQSIALSRKRETQHEMAFDFGSNSEHGKNLLEKGLISLTEVEKEKFAISSISGTGSR